ncbi:hypothetical protein, partial [Pseudohongiella sp.]
LWSVDRAPKPGVIGSRDMRFEAMHPMLWSPLMGQGLGSGSGSGQWIGLWSVDRAPKLGVIGSRGMRFEAIHPMLWSPLAGQRRVGVWLVLGTVASGGGKLGPDAL